MKKLFYALPILLSLFIAGCDVTAQNPPPHRLYWTDPDNPPGTIFGYHVWCGDQSGVYTQNWTVPEGTLEIFITTMNLSDGMHYCTVTAYNFVGDSAYSNEVEFYTVGGDLQVTKPNAPSGLGVE